MNLLHFAHLLKNKETSFDCTHLENRLIKCPDCKWTLEYINYAINLLDELSYGDING